jgi:hypothetical protein
LVNEAGKDVVNERFPAAARARAVRRRGLLAVVPWPRAKEAEAARALAEQRQVFAARQTIAAPPDYLGFIRRPHR